MADDEIQNAAGKTTAFLHRKAGPLEYWQIGVGIVGLVLAYMVYRARSGGASSSGTAQAAQDLNPISSTAPGDLGTTGQQTVLSGQLQNVESQLSALRAQPPGIQANQNPGQSSGAVGGFANWQAFENSPAALSLAQTNPNAYVTAQYQSILGRAPESQAVIAGWESQLGTTPTAASVTQENKAFEAATANEIAAHQVSTGQ